MKLRLLEYLRCPSCRAKLSLDAPGSDGRDRSASEVWEGTLRCVRCSTSFPIDRGIPRMLVSRSASRDHATTRTSTSFGYLWAQSSATLASIPPVYHVDKMIEALDLPRYAGLVLDAGCGEGIDLANRARDGQAEVIGVELSDGGCETTFNRIATIPLAHVVQADLRRLPFADATFDHQYSYGVLHHVSPPPAAAAELARVARPGADVSIYLYEDFGERAAGWRWALKAVNTFRFVTTSLPPKLLYALCQLGSPLVYATCTVPHRLLRRNRWTRRFAFSLPFRHGTGAFTLAGDLYDRFSAPVEFRYSRRGAADLLAAAGLRVIKIVQERGWMVHAEKPA